MMKISKFFIVKVLIRVESTDEKILRIYHKVFTREKS